jgi:hypothetical protein
MFDLIALFVFLASFIGIGVFLFRRMPKVLELQEISEPLINWKDLGQKTRTRLLPALKNFFEKLVNLPVVKNIVYKVKNSKLVRKLAEKFHDFPAVKRLKESTVLKKISIPKDFSFEAWLQRILSKIRVLVLKIDHKTAAWMQALRERAKQKNFLKNDQYWQKLKKLTKK